MVVYGWTMAEDLVKLGSARPAAMAEFADVVRRRRMTRAFEPDPIDPADCSNSSVDLANRAPERRQDAGLAPRGARGRADRAVLGHHAARRCGAARSSGKRLLDAPVILLPFADPAGLRRPLLRARQGGRPASAPGPRRGRRRTGRSTPSMAVMTCCSPPRTPGSGRCSSACSRASASCANALRHPTRARAARARWRSAIRPTPPGRRSLPGRSAGPARPPTERDHPPRRLVSAAGSVAAQ